MKLAIRFLYTISACVAAFCAGQGMLHAQWPATHFLVHAKC
jgi:hypothetical protein